jgi:glycosyltransferase involved in cell wall biosynthesis
MKVLHITSELSKKNFSIASIIIFITKYLNSYYSYKYSILSSKSEIDLFKDKNIHEIEFRSWNSIFLKIKNLSRYIENFDVIHIHGIWAPIQIFSIILCNFKKKNYVIHPHGMLLKEALRSAGFLKFVYKKIFLFFFKFLAINKLFFVAITNQEKQAIEIYFPNSKITHIYNPIPFEQSNIDTLNKKKQFVYFGRIHPHKNLDLVIKAFKKANLGQEWSLKIYGIQDDKKYFNKLVELIGKDSRIQIKQPVFEKQKQTILSESWLNILMSRSEVLSLSILESSIFGLPSLANKNLDLKNIEDSILTSEASIDNIKEKLELISNWTFEERLERGKNIYKNVNLITSKDKILSKYNNFYNSLLEDHTTEEIYKDKFLSRKNFKFLQTTGAYMFNLMFSSFIVVALVGFGYYSIAGELGLVISFWITLTQIFSSNLRSIIVSENKIEFAFITLFYRALVSIIFYSIAYFFIYMNFISFENLDLIILFSILILVQWINEMNLVKSEVQNKTLIFKIFLIINSITLILSTIFLFFGYFKYLELIIISYIAFVILSIISNYLNLDFKNLLLNYRSLIELNIKTIAFLSSFSIVISSFAWRMMIYFTFDKSLSGVFFACFSIGSFPGTVFNSVIGPAFIKQKIELSQNLKNFIYIIFVLILIFFLINLNYILNTENINYLSAEFVFFTVSISLIGSYFMSYAMYLRHKKIQSSLKKRTDLFQTDILYGMSVTFLIPVLYYLGNIVGVSFSFFIASLIALIAYSFSDKLTSYKINK